MENTVYIVYLEQHDENFTTPLGVVSDIEIFKKFATEKYNIKSDPKNNEYGIGSLHYDYTRNSGYYSLVAEQKIINKLDLVR